MLKNIKIGTEETYVEIKEMMSFFERREHTTGFGNTYAMDKDGKRIEVNTRAKFEDSSDYFLLKTQVTRIVENDVVIYDVANAENRRNFTKFLKEAYGETSENLENALIKIKEINELVKTKEDDEEEKNV